MAQGPLLELANSSIYISGSSNAPEVIDGRYVNTGNGYGYLISCYCTRTQAPSSSSMLGVYRENGPKLMGVDVMKFLYRGYCLRYASVSSNFEHGISNETNLVYNDVIGWSQFNNIVLRNIKCSFRLGPQVINDSYIEIVGGVYGSVGIDQIIYQELRGIPITLRGTQQI